MSRAVGVKKPQEAEKAKALWAMKAAKDRKEEFYDPAREDWEEHLEDPIVALDKAPKFVEDQSQSCLEASWKQGSNDQR